MKKYFNPFPKVADASSGYNGAVIIVFKTDRTYKI